MQDRWALGYGSASLLLLLVLVAFFWRPLLLGEVFYPHDNGRELGIATLEASTPSSKPSESGARLSNRKFSDQSSQFVPELQHQLTGEHGGWISTWNPHVELGRPTAHLGGLSKAFWLTHALSFISGDALRVYTWLVVLTTMGAAFFALLLFREEGLHPAASLAASLGIGVGVYSAYWATFALFLSGIAWTLAWLWLIRRTLRSPDPLGILGIVVVVQSLLLSAYPQQIVWHLWFVAVYTLHAALPASMRVAEPAHVRATRLAWIAGASLVGALAAAPAYLDVLVDAARSARLDVPTAFFASALPNIESAGDLLQELLQMLDAAVYGNSIDPARELVFNGFCLTPLYALGLIASLRSGGARRDWPLHLFAAVALLMTFASPIYAFGVEYLGLSLSRFTPSTAALIPAAILGARGFDSVLRSPARPHPLAIGFVAGTVGLLAMTSVIGSLQFDVRGVAILVGMLLLAAGFASMRSPKLLVGLAVLGVFVYSQPLLLLRPPEQIHLDSPLVQEIRRTSDDGSRFAWVDQWIIPPNQEALLGLRSIHTYDSLSSEAYQRWTREISARGATTYGRYFSAIVGDSKLSPAKLQRAGVGVLIARYPLDPELASPVARWGRLFIHRTRAEPIRFARTSAWRDEGEGRVALGSGVDVPVEGSPSIRGAMNAPGRSVVEALSRDDRSRFEFEALDRPSLLWLSRQFHPAWRAETEGRRLETVIVDDLFLGVVVPRDVSSVRLGFEPRVRWAWIPQACLLVALPFCAFWQRRRAAAALP